ncbi:hypothetical protein EG68_08719 [Paragonimus skrjabini miyazakii]|uniref:Uncharacterized protein n=1 Tax=Paragonimus skrjabini miyazakii TaxID=59628 RepID=A0A8S9YSB5_9TREM|nr:hypothetical protein EG68_08719 [Paragonimus skrjabini miyazakii]
MVIQLHEDALSQVFEGDALKGFKFILPNDHRLKLKHNFSFVSVVCTMLFGNSSHE